MPNGRQTHGYWDWFHVEFCVPRLTRGRAESAYQQGCPSCSRQHFWVDVFCPKFLSRKLPGITRPPESISASLQSTYAPHGGDVCSMQRDVECPQWTLWAPYGDPMQCCMCFYRDPNYLQPNLSPRGYLPLDFCGSTVLLSDKEIWLYCRILNF